jgi:hypothetical protein
MIPDAYEIIYEGIASKLEDGGFSVEEEDKPICPRTANRVSIAGRGRRPL